MCVYPVTLMAVEVAVVRGVLYLCAAGLTCIAPHPQIVPQNKYWDIVLVTGRASSQPSPTSHTGVSTLYTLDSTSGKMVKRGTVDRVCTGNTYYRLGWPGQGPGKIARAVSWDRVLTMNEIQAVTPQLMKCKTAGKQTSGCVARNRMLGMFLICVTLACSCR